MYSSAAEFHLIKNGAGGQCQILLYNCVFQLFLYAVPDVLDVFLLGLGDGVILFPG